MNGSGQGGLSSAKLWDRARLALAGGVSHDGRFLPPHPIYMNRAEGARKWDVEGREYIDYAMGSAAMMLGHGHPEVVAAVKHQIELGTFYATVHPLEIDWAELVQAMMPSAERVRFTASGTEATLLAIRVARAYSRRTKVLRFEGHFHGNEEHAARAIAERLPHVPVTASSSLVRARGEFERASTAVLNAYLTPMMADYLERLQSELQQRGVVAPVNIMGSNGGAMALSEAARRVAGTFLSGPVGGVNGAVQIGRMLGLTDLITLDMGGTSTDVALVHRLEPRMSFDNQVDAYPLQMPQLDIHAIGAGGGSIVWVGADGTLQIGPHSAGALPGPACYGRGGLEPTLSDANLLLGRLPADHALSGGLQLRLDLAAQAFQKLADELGETDLHPLAARALQIATAKMSGAVREVSVHRGFDPRDFVLVGYGGAGPMHVFEVAEELSIPMVAIPRFPGHLSALGQMLAELRHDDVRVWGGLMSELEPAALEAQVEAMQAAAAALLEQAGMAAARQQHAFSLDMRYRGQSFSLQIRYRAGQPWSALREEFDRRHEETFGYAAGSTDVEIVSVRLVSLGLVEKPELHFAQLSGGEPLHARRPVWFDGWRDCAIYDRECMPAGFHFEGPAVVVEAGGTSVVPPGWNVELNASGSLLCTHPQPFC